MSQNSSDSDIENTKTEEPVEKNPIKGNGCLPTEEKVSNPSSKESPEKPGKGPSLQHSFKVFDTILKGKTATLKERTIPCIETKRIFNKADTVEVHSGCLRSGRMKLSLLDEVEDVEINELNNYSQIQKSDLERKFKHINSNNTAIKEKTGGSKTGKNLFNKLKKFFV